MESWGWPAAWVMKARRWSCKARLSSTRWVRILRPVCALLWVVGLLASWRRWGAGARVNPMSKALLYSIARVSSARHFLCLDADLIVFRDLRPIFGALEALPDQSILACREGNSAFFANLGHASSVAYRSN